MQQKHENLNFAQLKKQAESIRNFFLCPEVMNLNKNSKLLKQRTGSILVISLMAG